MDIIRTWNFAQISSITPWFVFTPLDLARQRLQLQGELLKLGSYQKHGLIRILKLIYISDGIRGLYRGFIPIACLTQLNAMRLTAYDLAKTTFVPRLISASLIGYMTGFIASPINMAKTRVMSGKYDKRLFVNLKTICQSKQIFKGAYIAGFRNGGATLIQLPMFDYMLKVGKDLPEMGKLGLASFAATFSMISIGQPLEVVITRIYHEEEHTYKGFIHGIKLIFQHEGIHGLYKGYFASIMTFGPAAFLQLSMFQLLKDEFN